MDAFRRLTTGFVVGVILISGCAAPRPTTAPVQPGEAPPQQPAPFKRVTAAILGDPPHLNSNITGASSVAGIGDVQELVHASVTKIDNLGALRPQLAESVPSLENGLWRLLPDGRMETTWKIRPDAVWHDGTPFTADDLAFTLTVGQDRDLGIRQDLAYRAIEGVDVPDARTLRIRWRTPFIPADTMFTSLLERGFGMPIPKHLLERPYRDDKTHFSELPYWHEEFVGLGPFRLKEFARSSHVVLRAHDGYALGRPKVDEIEVKFLRDANALVANILAGAVDITLGRTFSLDQALPVRDQWREGRMEVSPAPWLIIWPQFVNANPSVVALAPFRRAMLYGLDRQEMIDGILHGQSTLAHSILDPASDYAYREAEQLAVRYEFDPTRAARLIQDLGYTKGPDGIFRDQAGSRLALEVRSTQTEPAAKTMLVVADHWKRLGVDASPVVIPRQLQDDREYRATTPAFEVKRQPNGVGVIDRYHGAQSPLPENNYIGSNYARYMNPEFDALIERSLATVPLRERVQVIGQIVRHMTDQLNVLPLFHDVSITMVSHRLLNAGAAGQTSSQAWNAEQWDVAAPG